MKTKALVLGLALPLLVAADTKVGGYEDARWSMTLAQVKKLYPGGVVMKKQDGETDYSVVRPVANHISVVGFGFQPKRGLRNVTLVFPKSGTSANLKARTYTPMDEDERKLFTDVLSSSLQLKYGKPIETEGENLTWVSGDTMIGLFPQGEGGAGGPAVLYRLNSGTMEELLKGL